MGSLSSWKSAPLFGKNFCIMGCTAVKGNNETNRIPRYCRPNHDRTSSVFHSWNRAFRIVGFLGRSPNVTSSWCRKHREGRLIWPYHAFPFVWLSDVQVSWSWHRRLCTWALLSVRLERILTMVYVVQSYWACFGLYPSYCMWKTKNSTTFRRLDLSPSSGVPVIETSSF
jgi:hypothetical protein